jgi:hypothetical protein
MSYEVIIVVRSVKANKSGSGALFERGRLGVGTLKAPRVVYDGVEGVRRFQGEIPKRRERESLMTIRRRLMRES